MSVIILALAETGVEHNKNRAEVKHNIIFVSYKLFSLFNIRVSKINGFLFKYLKTSIGSNSKNRSYDG